MSKGGLWLIGILASIGMVTTAFIAGYISDVLWRAIRVTIKGMRLKSKWKHRFNKPPLAKCYCIDCKFKEVEVPPSETDFYCNKVRATVAGHFFCGIGEPTDNKAVK